MSNFQMSCSLYMSAPVHTVRDDDSLQTVQKRLSELAISSLAVVSGEGKLVGVISRADLIRVGRLQAGSRGKAALLTVRDKKVSRHMARKVVTVGSGEPA